MYASHEDTYLAPTAVAPSRNGLTAGVVQAIATGLERWKRARIERQAIVTLASFDAHLLRDIGANRADIAQLVREGRR